MISLLVVIVSISLFAVLLTIGVDSVNTTKLYEAGHGAEIRMGLPTLSTALNNHYSAYGVYPDPAGDWRADVFPTFGFYPELSFNATYSFEVNGGALTTCVTMPNTEISREVATAVAGSDLFYAGHTCGTEEALLDTGDIVISM